MNSANSRRRRRGQPEPKLKGRPPFGKYDTSEEEEESKGAISDSESGSDFYIPEDNNVNMVNDVISKSTLEVRDSVIVTTAPSPTKR